MRKFFGLTAALLVASGFGCSVTACSSGIDLSTLSASEKANAKSLYKKTSENLWDLRKEQGTEVSWGDFISPVQEGAPSYSYLFILEDLIFVTKQKKVTASEAHAISVSYKLHNAQDNDGTLLNQVMEDGFLLTVKGKSSPFSGALNLEIQTNILW